MQRFFAPTLILTAHGAANPMNKVLELMDACTGKVKADGEAEAKAYKEYFDWCDETSTALGFDIKGGSGAREKLEARIGKLTSDISVGTTKIEDLTAAIAADDADLKAATKVRAQEAADFAAAEAELVDGVNFLGRAIGYLQREREKGALGAAALAQIDTSSLSKTTEALSTIMSAAGMTGADKDKLKAFLQSQDDDDDDDTGAPDAAVYQKKPTIPIEDILQGMKDKADGELADLRKVETQAHHSFSMLRSSLETKISADTKNLSDEKSGVAAAKQGKAEAEGDLSMTSKDLASAKDALATTHRDCLTVASDHEVSIRARQDELKVIAEAKKILEESTGAAISQSYSLLQIRVLQSRIKSSADLKNNEVVVAIQKLARETKSVKLAQLASKISSVITYGGPDIFAKVKSMIEQDIAEIEREMADDSTEKSYCDEEMAKTEAKKAELDEDLAKLTAKIDKAASQSASVKERVAEAQESLLAITKNQVELDTIRREQNADYKRSKADLEAGITGVEKALAVLRDYYGAGSAALIQSHDDWSASMMQQPARPVSHSRSTGGASGIIAILELVESDFSKDLANEEAAESDAQESYDKQTQENKIQKTMKEQDVKYQTQEFKSLDAEIAELTSDSRTVGKEHDAVLEYYSKLKGRCIAKPSTFEERKARREEEIAGLKETLAALDEAVAFAQVRKRRGGLKFAKLGF
jgi:hypothetical protein